MNKMPENFRKKSQIADVATHEKVNSVLEQIRPFLQSDGGDIELVEVSTDWIVRVRLLGACNNCPMSLQTLKAGVEHTLRRAFPELKKVVEVDRHKL